MQYFFAVDNIHEISTSVRHGMFISYWAVTNSIRQPMGEAEVKFYDQHERAEKIKICTKNKTALER